MSAAASPERAPSLDRHESARLRACVAEEISAQKEVLAMLDRMSRALATSDAAAVFAVTEDADPVLRRVEEAARRRSELLVGAARRLGLSPETARLSDVAARAGGGDGAELARADRDLREVLTAVSTRNRRNAELARGAAELNTALLHAIFGATAEEPKYGPDGAARREPSEPSRWSRDA